MPLEYIRYASFQELGFTAITTTRRGGTSKGPYAESNFSLSFQDDIPNVLDNWNALLDDCNLLQHQCVLVKQVHSSMILEADELLSKSSTPGIHILGEGDAIISNQDRTALCILTADCLPVFICDKGSRAFGIVHAGWKGTQTHVLLKTIEQFIAKYESRPDNIYLAFGPCISQESYKVGEEFKSYFPEKYFKKKDNQLYFDLRQVNIDQSLYLEVPVSNMEMLDGCTFKDDNLYYSHRKSQGITGRLLHLITRQ